MQGFLIALLLLPAYPQSAGFVTGVVQGAPAAGVRVFAMKVRDSEDTATPLALEAQALTDATGRYRLELPPGRYNIASGSVASPTYFPGTLDRAMAQVVTVTEGATVSSIDFASFVAPPANPGIRVLVAQGTGVLSGMIRNQDGSPAQNVPVVAVPASATQAGAIRVVSSIVNFSSGFVTFFRSGSAATDLNGRYKLENLPPDTYYIAAGLADAPFLYPGTRDPSAAQPIVTTATTKMDNLDFAIAPPPAGFGVRGRVLATDGAAGEGVTVRIQNRNPLAAATASLGLPARGPVNGALIGPDGIFEFQNIVPGDYDVVATVAGMPDQKRNVTVSTGPVEGIDVTLPLAILSGRIVMEDGSPVTDPRLFQGAVVTTTNNPNIVTSTIMPVSATGVFNRLLEAGVFRFGLRVLPEEYEVRSMRAGDADLLNETLNFTGKESVLVDVRVAPKASTAAGSGTRVRGVVLDAVSGTPSPAVRIGLCCLSGAADRISTPLGPDGSFEFATVPPGQYELGLQARNGDPDLFLVSAGIDVGTEEMDGVQLASTTRLVNVRVSLVVEGSGSLPTDANPSIVFTSSSGRIRVVATKNNSTQYFAALPAGTQYIPTVADLPPGYEVKSTSGTVSVPAVASAPASAFRNIVGAPNSVSVILVSITIGRVR